MLVEIFMGVVITASIVDLSENVFGEIIFLKVEGKSHLVAKRFFLIYSFNSKLREVKLSFDREHFFAAVGPEQRVFPLRKVRPRVRPLQLEVRGPDKPHRPDGAHLGDLLSRTSRRGTCVRNGKLLRVVFLASQCHSFPMKPR